MARDAMLKQATNAALESKRGNGKSGKKVEKIQCKECSNDIEKFIWNRRQGKTIERDMCFNVGRNQTHLKVKGSQDKKKPPHDETSALQNNATDHFGGDFGGDMHSHGGMNSHVGMHSDGGLHTSDGIHTGGGIHSSGGRHWWWYRKL